MAYAVIRTGGKQYRVSEGDTLEIEKLNVEPGSKAKFDDVLLVASDAGVRIGTPVVKGASVTADVVDQIKGDKIVAFKYRRRKGYHRTVGHRQRLTKVKITAIQG